MSKEKEIVLILRDILDRTNELDDAAKCDPIDIGFIRERQASYLEKSPGYKQGVPSL